MIKLLEKGFYLANAEVFTPPEVVDYMIKAVECTLGRFISLGDKILEPSAGDGAFIVPLLRQLVQGATPCDWSSSLWDDLFKAFEINPQYVGKLEYTINAMLVELGCPEVRAQELVQKWIVREDFLLANLDGMKFDIVIGNPPYIRYDAISKEKVKKYQSLFSTFRGRCDLYVPFIQKALSLLTGEGVFCFICSNRFTKSDYGRFLRAYLSDQYHIGLYLNLEHAKVFGKKIAAYPAILVIDRKLGAPTFAATINSLASCPLTRFQYGASQLLSLFPKWYSGKDPWLTTDISTWNWMCSLDEKLPLLSESASGTQIGIGVATGNDDVFIVKAPVAQIEKDCLLPLATSEDIRQGRIHGDYYLVNPYATDGSGCLRVLDDWPGLKSYLVKHREELGKRFVSQKGEWYRTIDRVNDWLFHHAKILLPDIQSGGIVGIDSEGTVYPHHNVYWIISEEWPLYLLASILKSEFVSRQIRLFSSEMRGGSIRYQVKNLERLRIPPYTAFSPEEKLLMEDFYIHNNTAGINLLVNKVVECYLQDENPKPLPKLRQQHFVFK